MGCLLLRLCHGPQLLLEVANLVTQARRQFELQLFGRGMHLIGKLANKVCEILCGKAGLPAQDLADLIRQLSDQMHTAAEQLQFELAARLRDEIRDLKKELRAMTQAQQ